MFFAYDLGGRTGTTTRSSQFGIWRKGEKRRGRVLSFQLRENKTSKPSSTNGLDINLVDGRIRNTFGESPFQSCRIVAGNVSGNSVGYVVITTRRINTLRDHFFDESENLGRR